MGQQDVRQRPAFAFKGLQDWCGLGDIDDGGVAAGGIVQQISIIVGQAWNGQKFVMS